MYFPQEVKQRVHPPSSNSGEDTGWDQFEIKFDIVQKKLWALSQTEGEKLPSLLCGHNLQASGLIPQLEWIFFVVMVLMGVVLGAALWEGVINTCTLKIHNYYVMEEET